MTWLYIWIADGIKECRYSVLARGTLNLPLQSMRPLSKVDKSHQQKFFRPIVIQKLVI